MHGSGNHLETGNRCTSRMLPSLRIVPLAREKSRCKGASFAPEFRDWRMRDDRLKAQAEPWLTWNLEALTPAVPNMAEDSGVDQ
jgi:hypothetical protein